MKKVYRIISTILVAAMITSSLSVMAAPNYVEQTEEVLGTSVQTPAEPTSAKPSDDDIKLDIVDGIIQIDDEQDLAKIGNDNSYPLDGEYILTADITMTENFHPIGKEGASFTGTFDGDGHVIYDLTIEEEGDNVGLFGVASEGAIIKNVGIENGSVTSEGLKVGGLVGWAVEATIENCYFVGDVSGDVAVGGLVGGSGQIGAFNTASTIKNCYQVGTVKGNNVVGGIEGVVASPGFSFSKMENCYHVGEIICAEAWCGGLIGYLYAEISYYYENSYYDIEQCGSVVKNAVGYQTINKSSSNIKGLTTEQMTGSDSFNNMIGMEEAYTAAPEQKVDKEIGYYSYYYPQLNIFINDASDINEYPSTEIYEPQNNIMVEPVEDNDPSTIVPEGYIPVSTVEDLKAIDKDDDSRGKNYYLTTDIDMSDVENFDPIGTEDHDFHGNFDGGGHVIYNLNVDTGEDDYAGLFGCVGSEGTVKNLGVEGTVKGDNYVGGLVGWLSDYATLENCYFIGNVKGNSYIGGLVGQSGDKGIWSGGSSDIINCYNIGKIEGNEYVGGIVGLLLITRDAPKVENCYHTGTVNCLEVKCKAVGGLVGYFAVAHYFGAPDEENILKNSYYDKDTSNIKKAIGEVNFKSSITEGDHDEWSFKGLTTGEMTGSDALNYMTNLKDYIAAPNDDGYPQLSIFVRDKNDPSQFPTIDMAE